MTKYVYVYKNKINRIVNGLPKWAEDETDAIKKFETDEAES